MTTTEVNKVIAEATEYKNKPEPSRPLRRSVPQAEEIYTNWNEPDKGFLNRENKKAPELPLDLFGSQWKELITLTALSANCSTDFIATSLLCVSAGIIGNTRKVMAWEGWQEPIIIWASLVGNPSSGKSPALDKVLDPLKEIEKEMGKQFPDLLLSYDTEKEAAIAALEQWKNEVKDATKKDVKTPLKPKEAVIPECPVRPRFIIKDTTIEKAAMLSGQLPRGLILFRDELSGFVENFERNGGNDKQFYLEAFGGRPYTVDRVKHPEPIMIDALSISIIGGIQPDNLGLLFKNQVDDGFAARFIYAWPEQVDFERPRVKPDERFINNAFRKLAALEMITDEEFNQKPKIVPLSEEAQDIFEEWKKEFHYKEQEYSGILVSHIGKLSGIVLRLSAIFMYLEWVTVNEPEPNEVSKDQLLRAIGIVTGYFFPMAERCFGEAGLTLEQKDLITVAKWILREKPNKINASEFKRMAGSPLRSTKRLTEVLKNLVEMYWLEKTGTREGSSYGRKKDDYTVNPKLYEEICNG